MRRFISLLVCGLLVGLFIVPINKVLAITDEQRRVYDANAGWFDIEEGDRRRPAAPGPPPPGGGGAYTGPLTGRCNAERIYDFFTKSGLTPIQAVGIMGNLQAESHFDPAITEIGNGIGFGIAQWSFERRTSLEEEAAATDPPTNPASLDFQLGYLFRESNLRESVTDPSAPSEWEGLRRINDVAEAVTYWEANFERPAVAGQQIRIDFANELLAGLGSGTYQCQNEFY